MLTELIISPPPRAIPQSAMKGAGLFSSFIGGAFGYVRSHHVKQAAVTVELMNGIILHSVGVPSRLEWVANTANEKSTGAMDLPPVGSLVFVLFPYGIENTSGAMVLFSVFDDTNKKHQEFFVEGDEAKVVRVREGGIKTTYDRATGNYLIEDVDDANFSILLDKENGAIALADWNGNAVTIDADGIEVADSNGNNVIMDSAGIILETDDAQVSRVTLNSDGAKLEGKGNTVTLETGKTTINNNLEVAI